MKFITCVLVIFLLFIPTNSTEAQEVNQKELEEVLITQFHPQIVTAIKKEYRIGIPQYEPVKIISIKKEYIPEPSEEMKPGHYYEIQLQVKVLHTSNNNLIITLSNNHSSGQFVVTHTKR